MRNVAAVSLAQAADVPDFNKNELNQKNCLRTLFKFYKEHLYPINPIPTFKHVLTWALQTGEFSINWQFSCGRQFNWEAAEANWKLMIEPENCGWEIVKLAMIDPKCTDPDCRLFSDPYENANFQILCATTEQTRSDLREERLHEMLNGTVRDGGTEDRDAEGNFSLDDMVANLVIPDDNSASDSGDDQTAVTDSQEPEGDQANGDDTWQDWDETTHTEPNEFRLPVYAEAAALRMAAQPPSPSIPSDDSQEMDELMEDERPIRRSRYIDDEAGESDSEEI